MKITRRHLSQLIKEEIAGSLSERLTAGRAAGDVWSVGREIAIGDKGKGEQSVDTQTAAISAVIKKLEELDKSNLQKGKVIDESDLKALSEELKKHDIRPVDIDASIGKDAAEQRRYLITGPSAPGGSGKGALNALMAMIKEEE